MSNGLAFPQRISGIGRRRYSAGIGLIVGVIGGLIGLSLAVAGPVITGGLAAGVLAGLYVLSNVTVALYGVVAIAVLLPFGTLPFSIGFTPTLLDLAVGAFLLVYLAQWMTGKRHHLRRTPVHGLLLVYILWLLLAFTLGLRFAMPTLAVLRQFTEMLVSISLVGVLVDLLRHPEMFRKFLLVFFLFASAQALVTVILYVLPDETAERALVRLARIGYPNGGVIRYIEDNPALAERAIGTWVDPNALGGIMAVTATLIAPQLLAKRPILQRRWLIALGLGLLVTALALTFSRASILALAAGLCFIGLFHGYKRYLAIVLLGTAFLFFLPQGRLYVERFVQALTATDRATQMRLGEYGDSLQLISRNPVSGVGFTGTPEIGLYTDVASMYLIMANQIGLIGLGIYLTVIIGVLWYGWQSRLQATLIPVLEPIHLGAHAALLTALINATADLYFFRLDFQAPIALFWIVIGLALASSRTALEPSQSTVAINR